jgi:hypothetical protein
MSLPVTFISKKLPASRTTKGLLMTLHMKPEAFFARKRIAASVTLMKVPSCTEKRRNYSFKATFCSIILNILTRN